MTRFDLPCNFDPNPERIGRIVRHHVVLPQKRVTWPSGSPSTSASSPMAQKTLHQFSAPSSSHIPTGLNVNQAGNDGFELKTGLVNMIQASPFCGNFLEVSNTINPKGTTLDIVRLHLFPFSLLGKAKTWFYSNKEAFTTWCRCLLPSLLRDTLSSRVCR